MRTSILFWNIYLQVAMVKMTANPIIFKPFWPGISENHITLNQFPERAKSAISKSRDGTIFNDAFKLLINPFPCQLSDKIIHEIIVSHGNSTTQKIVVAPYIKLQSSHSIITNSWWIMSHETVVVMAPTSVFLE